MGADAGAEGPPGSAAAGAAVHSVAELAVAEAPLETRPWQWQKRCQPWCMQRRWQSGGNRGWGR